MFGRRNNGLAVIWTPIFALLFACATASKAPVEGGVLAPGVAMDPDMPDVAVFHHSEITVVSRVEPTLPEAGKRLKAEERVCLVRTYIDAAGTPWKAVARDCPAVLTEPAETCVLSWRFEPPRNAEGEIVPASVTYRVAF